VENIWNETVVAYFKIPFGHLQGERERERERDEKHNNLSQDGRSEDLV
jgi:hypothetical protein